MDVSGECDWKFNLVVIWGRHMPSDVLGWCQVVVFLLLPDNRDQQFESLQPFSSKPEFTAQVTSDEFTPWHSGSRNRSLFFFFWNKLNWSLRLTCLVHGVRFYSLWASYKNSMVQEGTIRVPWGLHPSSCFCCHPCGALVLRCLGGALVCWGISDSLPTPGLPTEMHSGSHSCWAGSWPCGFGWWQHPMLFLSGGSQA